MNDNSGHKNKNQLIWGIALALVGLAVFVRIPQVMPELEKIHNFQGVTGFIRVCFYLMGIILLGGGIKKIIHYIQSDTAKKNNQTNESFKDQ